jgi:hypothetical protein
LLGHERLRTTQLYIRVSDIKLKEDYQAAIGYVDAQLSAPGGAP